MNQTILWILGVFALLAFIVVLIIQSYKRRLSDTTTDTKQERLLFANTVTGRKLQQLLQSVSTDGKQTQEILRELTVSPADCIVACKQAYANMPERAYHDRWLIVYCLSLFELPAFVEPLLRIAASPVPEEQSQDIHLFSTVAQETAIRLTAVEGLKNMAVKNSREATEALFTLLNHPVQTIQIAVTQALLTSNPSSYSLIMELLPAEKHFIADIRKLPVSEIPFSRIIDEHSAGPTQQTLKPLPGKTGHKTVITLSSHSKPPKIN